MRTDRVAVWSDGSISNGDNRKKSEILLLLKTGRMVSIKVGALNGVCVFLRGVLRARRRNVLLDGIVKYAKECCLKNFESIYDLYKIVNDGSIELV